MRDCYYERDTVFGDFDRIRDITQIDLVGHEKHHTGSLAFKRRSGCSATLHAVPLSERNSGGRTSRNSKKTAGNKTKRKMEYWSTIPRVMMMTFHLWSERLIFTRKRSPLQKNCSLQQQNCVQLIFLYLRCYGTMGLRDLLCLMHLLKLLFVSLILIYLYLYVCP